MIFSINEAINHAPLVHRNHVALKDGGRSDNEINPLQPNLSY